MPWLARREPRLSDGLWERGVIRSTAYCPSRAWQSWKGRLEPVRTTDDKRYFATFGVPCNPESAIYTGPERGRHVQKGMIIAGKVRVIHDD